MGVLHPGRKPISDLGKDTATSKGAKSTPPSGQLLKFWDEILVNPPEKFSWVDEDRLCAFATPENEAEVCFLRQVVKVDFLISLSPESKVPLELQESVQRYEKLPIPPDAVPTIPQVDWFLRACRWAASKNLIVGVHCRHGLGRTGTLLATYLMDQLDVNAKDAVMLVRLYRPDSIRNLAQLQFLFVYRKHLENKKQLKRNGKCLN